MTLLATQGLTAFYGDFQALFGVDFAVGEGEKVEPGQRLAVVEAMKMEHALVAPHAGVVRDLTVDIGDQVDMGERLMRVEAEGRTGGEGKD